MFITYNYLYFYSSCNSLSVVIGNIKIKIHNSFIFLVPMVSTFIFCRYAHNLPYGHTFQGEIGPLARNCRRTLLTQLTDRF